MEVLNLLELLEDIIEEGSKLPFGNKVMIDKSKALEILRDVRISLPDEVKQAEWINTERQRIIDDAKEEAEKMIKDTEDYIKQKVADSEITKKAQENAKEIIEKAENKAKDLKDGSREYAIEVLKKLDTDLGKLNSRLQKKYAELREFDL